MDKKFLIIIPFYNVEKCLEESIEGILQQDYQNFHLVLVDDDSTDNSRQVVEKYKNNNKISFLYNTKNEGCYYCVNKALLANLNGDWDYWHYHGGDDVSDLTRLNKINEFLKANPNTVGLKTTYVRVWHDTKKINYENGKPHITTSEGISFYSKKLLSHLGYYDNTRFSGDTDYWWRLENFIKLNPLYNFELGEHKDPLYIAYLRGKKENLTLSIPIQGLERQKYYQKIIDEIKTQMIPNNNFYREIF